MNYGAFKRLCIAHTDELYAYAMRLTRSTFDAEDLVQTTYARAFSRWRQLRKPAAMRAWLFQILRGIFLNQRSRAARPPFLELVPSGKEPEPPASLPPPGEFLDRVLSIEIQEAVDQLPEGLCEVVTLADIWGFTYPEIAQIVGCPVGTVRSRLHRARASLAVELEELARQRGLLRHSVTIRKIRKDSS